MARNPLGGPNSSLPSPVVNSKSMSPALTEMFEIASLSIREVFCLEPGKPAIASSKALVVESEIFLRAWLGSEEGLDRCVGMLVLAGYLPPLGRDASRF